MGDAGFEPDSVTSLQDSGLQQTKNPGGAESDAPGNLTLISDPRLSALVAVWDRLPRNVQAEILLLAHRAIHLR